MIIYNLPILPSPIFKKMYNNKSSNIIVNSFYVSTYIYGRLVNNEISDYEDFILEQLDEFIIEILGYYNIDIDIDSNAYELLYLSTYILLTYFLKILKINNGNIDIYDIDRNFIMFKQFNNKEVN